MIKEIIFPGIVGTSAMTAFSYMISNKQGENFKEPEILGKFIGTIGTKEKKSTIAGALLHYLVGISFTIAYDFIWKKTKLKPGFRSGFVLGLLNGFVGIAGWKIVFTAHPDPPHIHLNKYFGHLILAHAIFGATVALTQKAT